MLQGFYVGVAIYGYLNFGGDWRVEHRSLIYHIIWIGLGIVGSLSMGYWLKRKTRGSWSYVDAAVTIFSMIGTWQMMNFIHENWLYLIAVNAVSVVLYSWRRLWLAAAMFVLYLVMSVDGYVESITWFGS
jgi:nicotinamide mononucleotide transporter